MGLFDFFIKKKTTQSSITKNMHEVETIKGYTDFRNKVILSNNHNYTELLNIYDEVIVKLNAILVTDYEYIIYDYKYEVNQLLNITNQLMGTIIELFDYDIIFTDLSIELYDDMKRLHKLAVVMEEKLANENSNIIENIADSLIEDAKFMNDYANSKLNLTGNAINDNDVTTAILNNNEEIIDPYDFTKDVIY